MILNIVCRTIDDNSLIGSFLSENYEHSPFSDLEGQVVTFNFKFITCTQKELEKQVTWFEAHGATVRLKEGSTT